MSKMAYYQKPDKEEFYQHYDRDYFFVVSYYNDIPNMANWRYEDKSGVEDSDTDTIEKIQQMIKDGNYKLVKTV